MNHLDAAARGRLIARLGAGERGHLLHLVECPRCRLELAEELEDLTPPPLLLLPLTAPLIAPIRPRQPEGRIEPAEAAAERVWRKVAERLSGSCDRVRREREQALGLVGEILALPLESWADVAVQERFWLPEVVWQLLEVSRAVEEPLAALPLAGVAQEVAARLAARHPGGSIYAELQIEAACELAERLLACGRLDRAAARLREAARWLGPDQVYVRAVFCRALARLRRAERLWEEALALIERAVSLFDEAEELHGRAMGEAQVEHGWILLDAGEPEEAATVFNRALEIVGEVPRIAGAARQGLALALERCRRGGEPPGELASQQSGPETERQTG